MQISAQDFNALVSQGYSEAEIKQAMHEVEAEELNQSFQQVQYARQNDPRQRGQISAFATKQDDNLVRWQLELNDILERAEHILKGDIPAFEDGNVIWKKSKTPEANPLNEIGVQEILKILAMYVNRNTILSDYSNEEISIKVFDFGREVNNLIFMRYDDFGMDTEEKKKNYPILVREIVDLVHSAYKRALEGSEKRSLREMVTISQSTSAQMMGGAGVTINNQGQPVKERGLLNPARYVMGKYK